MATIEPECFMTSWADAEAVRVRNANRTRASFTRESIAVFLSYSCPQPFGGVLLLRVSLRLAPSAARALCRTLEAGVGLVERQACGGCRPFDADDGLSGQADEHAASAVPAAFRFVHAGTCRTVMTGHVAPRTTRSATLPSMKRPRPPRPCVPITMYEAPSRCAVLTISS